MSETPAEILAALDTIYNHKEFVKIPFTVFAYESISAQGAVTGIDAANFLKKILSVNNGFLLFCYFLQKEISFISSLAPFPPSFPEGQYTLPLLKQLASTTGCNSMHAPTLEREIDTTKNINELLQLLNLVYRQNQFFVSIPDQANKTIYFYLEEKHKIAQIKNRVQWLISKGTLNDKQLNQIFSLEKTFATSQYKFYTPHDQEISIRILNRLVELTKPD